MIHSTSLAFLPVPFIVTCCTTHIMFFFVSLISGAAAHNFGWDDSWGTGVRNKFGANNEVRGRDCKVLPSAFTAPYIEHTLNYCLIITAPVQYLTQAGETIKHNQPHTQVNFRAFQPLSLTSLLGLNIYGVTRTAEDIRLALKITFSLLYSYLKTGSSGILSFVTGWHVCLVEPSHYSVLVCKRKCGKELECCLTI